MAILQSWSALLFQLVRACKHPIGVLINGDFLLVEVGFFFLDMLVKATSLVRWSLKLVMRQLLLN